MANVTIKLFGVLRVDTHLAKEQIEADNLEEVFIMLNRKVDEQYRERLKEHPGLEHPAELSFKDAIVYMNGTRIKKKSQALTEGAEIWLLSPASGG